jgi:HD-like signal output (HDOD) protein
MAELAERLVKDFARRDDLPAFPAVGARLLTTLGRHDLHMDELAEIVLQDPAIAGQVLRAANSAALSGRVRIDTVTEAIPRLGVLHLRRLAMMVCAQSVFPLDGSAFPHQVFWAHSLAVAHAAEIVLARMARVPADTVAEALFIAGLMHDIGLLALASFYPEEYRKIARDAEARGVSHDRAEAAGLHGSHGEIGGVLARHWLLPEPMTAAIRWHHHPRAAAQEHRWTVRLIHLADHLACRATGEFPTGASDGYDDATPVALGVATSAIFRICADIRAQSRRAAFSWA